MSLVLDIPPLSQNSEFVARNLRALRLQPPADHIRRAKETSTEPVLVTMKRKCSPNSGGTRDLERIRKSPTIPPSQRHELASTSLQLKYKEFMFELKNCELRDSLLLERKLNALGQQLFLLFQNGVELEDKCKTFLKVILDRISSYQPAIDEITVDKRWQIAKIMAMKSEAFRVKNGLHTCSAYEMLFDEIEVLLEAMEASRKEGITLWNAGKSREAVPLLFAADRYLHRLLLKWQIIQIDQTMLASAEDRSSYQQECPVHVQKKTTKRVAFRDNPEIIGTADPAVDRSPGKVSYPSKIEILLIRASRQYTLDAQIQRLAAESER